jgi:hypothetical protein
VLSPLPRGGHHVEGALSLLLVRAALASPVETAAFERVEPDRWRLRIGDAPARGGLLYVPLRLDTESVLTAERTLSAVVQTMVESRRSIHWLVVPAHADPLRAVGAIEGAPLRIDERRELGAYRAYRFGLSPSAPTAADPAAGASAAQPSAASQPIPVQPTSRLAISSRGAASRPRAMPIRDGTTYRTSSAKGSRSSIAPTG